MLSRLTLLSAGLLATSLSAATFDDVHPAANPNDSTYLAGVSADGTVAVGYLDIGNGEAIRIVGGVTTPLGLLAGGSFSLARAASADGSVIVGNADSTITMGTAFRWTSAGLTDLGSFDGPGGQSDALAISPDGTIVAGWSYDSARLHLVAFKHVGGVMSSLHADLLSGAYGNSQATGVAATGAITGYALDLMTGRDVGFLVNGGTFTPILNPDNDVLQARGISADGTTVVGYLIDGMGRDRAFRWTTTGGTAVSLGTLGGVSSEANAVSADGKVVVGKSRNFLGNEEAFRFKIDAANPAGVMTGLGFLTGGSSSVATGVSADGNVVVGHGTVTGGYTHAFVYADAVLLDATEWMASLAGPAGHLPTVGSLARLALEGAHHRPLMSYDGMGKDGQAWVTGDFGTSSRRVDSRVASGEAGFSRRFGDALAGVAVGHGAQDNDLLFGGSSRVEGQYLLGEFDYRLPDKESIVSFVATIGRWQADTLRGYATGGGTDYSRGETDLSSASARLRYDGPAQRFLGRLAVAPFASFTLTRTSADAYAESGGSFDAAFDRQTQTSREGRLGLTATYALGEQTGLRATAEWIRRFDRTQAGFSGVDLDHGALPFAVAGSAVVRDQARFGFDVDHRLSADTLLSFTVHVTGRGEAPDVSGALSLRRAF